MNNSTDNAYKVDLRKFVLLLLPTALRKPLLYHIVWWLVLPLVAVYRSFYQRRKNNLFFARYDSGKGNIERLLNIYFFGEYSASNKQIELENTTNTAVEYEPLYITTDMETDSAFVGLSYVDAPKTAMLLNIKVPATIYTQKYNQVLQLANNYILPGVGFKIIQKQ